jgi:hypothetical protein
MFGEPAVRVYQKLRIPFRLLATWLLVWASKGEGQSQVNLMSSWRGRMQLAERELAAEASENPLEHDPWYAPTS